MKKIIVIPARFASTRLPGKPLKDIQGKPMVVRVVEAAMRADVDDVVVATDDEKIKNAVEGAGFKVVMTKTTHVSGTDRLQEAAAKLGLANEDIVINLQGDEPLMPADNLEQVSELLLNHPDAAVATLFEEEVRSESVNDPNKVKLVQGQGSNVLYFSRAPIPFNRDSVSESTATIKRHVGIYAYRKSALDEFVTYKEGQLESLEKLEQLRFMENGASIVAEKAVRPIPAGVDTQEDLEQVIAIFKDKKV